MLKHRILNIKVILPLLLIFLCIANGNGQPAPYKGTLLFDLTNAQENYAGKYLVATFMVEKAFPCYKIEYCILNFSKKYVEVSYPIKTYCITKELSNKQNIYNSKPTKKYRWKIVNEKLCIPKFKNFNVLMFEEKSESFIKDLYSLNKIQ